MEKLRGWGLFIFRIFIGGRIFLGVIDKALSAEKMEDFALFLENYKVPFSDLAAPVSVYAQMICGVLLLLGLETRFVALLMTLNFLVAFVSFDIHHSLVLMTPTLAMLFGSVLLWIEGPGRFSLDGLIYSKKEK